MADAYGWGGQEKPGLFTLYKSQQKKSRIEGGFTIADRDCRSGESKDESQNVRISLWKSLNDPNIQRRCRNNMLYLSFLQNVKPKRRRISNLIENCDEVQNKMDSLTKLLHLNIQQRHKTTIKGQNDSMISQQRKKSGVKTQSVQMNNTSLSIEAIKQKYFQGKKQIDPVHYKKNSEYQVYKPKNQRVVVRNVLKINDFFRLDEKIQPQRHSQVANLSGKKCQTNTNPFKYLVVGEKRPYVYNSKGIFNPDKQTKDYDGEPQTVYQRFLHRQRNPEIKYASQRLKGEGRVSDFREADDNSIQAYQAHTKTALRKPSKIKKHRKNISLLNGHHINFL